MLFEARNDEVGYCFSHASSASIPFIYTHTHTQTYVHTIRLRPWTMPRYDDTTLRGNSFTSKFVSKTRRCDFIEGIDWPRCNVSTGQRWDAPRFSWSPRNQSINIILSFTLILNDFTDYRLTSTLFSFCLVTSNPVHSFARVVLISPANCAFINRETLYPTQVN